MTMIRKVLTTLAMALILAVSCGSPVPAAPRRTLAAGWDWTDVKPRTAPVTQRRIEVIDRIGSRKWKVRQASEWLDRYTGSNMVTVKRCSKRAWRCIYVKRGKLGGSLVGWTSGNTITIDVRKMNRSKYRSATHRKRLLAHEIGHTFGLDHRGSRNLMAPTVNRMRLKLTPGQRKFLRSR
jgi:hypothetical protein